MTEEKAIGTAILQKYRREIYSGLCSSCGEVAFDYRYPEFGVITCSKKCAGAVISKVNAGRYLGGMDGAPLQYKMRIYGKARYPRKNRSHRTPRAPGAPRMGPLSPRWKGGINVSRSGYTTVYAPGHKNASKNKTVLQHRLVMEAHLGRPLEKFENVHHKNGLRSDNRIENLELWAKPQPCGQRVQDLVSWVFDNYNAEIRNKIEIQDLVRSVISRVSEVSK